MLFTLAYLPSKGPKQIQSRTICGSDKCFLTIGPETNVQRDKRFLNEWIMSILALNTCFRPKQDFKKWDAKLYILTMSFG